MPSRPPYGPRPLIPAPADAAWRPAGRSGSARPGDRGSDRASDRGSDRASDRGSDRASARASGRSNGAAQPQAVRVGFPATSGHG
jgi:hypothetical protein